MIDVGLVPCTSNEDVDISDNFYQFDSRVMKHMNLSRCKSSAKAILGENKNFWRNPVIVNENLKAGSRN